MAQVVFRPSDYYSTRGLGLRVDVDEHFNWGRVMAVVRSGSGYGDRAEVPGLERLVREVASWTGLQVCQTNGTEWTPRYYLVTPMSGVPLSEGSRLTLVDRKGLRATGRVELNHGSLVLDTSQG
jgi:hypothetical protein